MCKLFDEWAFDIQKYCNTHNFDFDRLKEMSQCSGRDFVALQFHDPSKGEKGLKNETPMPLVLLISKNKQGKLEFQQTEYTQKYLGKAS